MDISLLIQSLMGLIVILAVLTFFLIYIPRKIKPLEKKEAVHPHAQRDDFKTLKSLVDVLKDKNSTSQELKIALDLILKYHGTIHPKLGIRPHPDFDLYAEVILRICRHPNTNKRLVIEFDRELEDRNEDYKKDINDFLSKGLNSRGF